MGFTISGGVVLSGGGGSAGNKIVNFSFSSDGNASNVGTLTQSRQHVGGHQY